MTIPAAIERAELALHALLYAAQVAGAQRARHGTIDGTVAWLLEQRRAYALELMRRDHA